MGKKINVAYTYTESYIPPRCRKPRYRDAQGETVIEIPVVTPKDAPVAFRHPDGQLSAAMDEEYYGWGDYSNRIEYYKTLTQKEYRFWNGNLYARQHMGGLVCGGKGWRTVEDLEDHLSTHNRYRWSFSLGKCPDTKEEVEYAIQAGADEYLLVDNGGVLEVWVKDSEPMYNFVTFGLGHNHGGTGMFIENHYNPNIPATHYFNALHRDEAINAAVAAALLRGDDKSVESILSTEVIEVLMPECVKRNPMKDHGDGDPFQNKLNAITEIADSAFEAGLLVIAETAKNL